MIDSSLHPSAETSNQPHEAILGPQPGTPRVGLFDSGVGGLSVLRALQREMPWLDYIYCGDTARLPYGKRKPETIVQYSMQASRFLVESGVDVIIIACNTASSVALGAMQSAFPNVLIQGVVEAGAQAAMDATQTGRIAVIGTECTVASKAYEKAIARRNPTVTVHSHACPFLVSLAEEGWTECDIAASVVRKYLEPLFETFTPHKPDTLILGCTHFSRFKSVIQKMAGPEVTLVDPADQLASEQALLQPKPDQGIRNRIGTTTFHATDALHRFARVGELFLDSRIPLDSLQRVTLDNQ